MTLGFIIIRHVNNTYSDNYWKECYIGIRNFYDNPIVIIDDSSNRNFLNENVILKNCEIIYDTKHKGAAELLPYYYFHKLKPFDTAVIIHDSIFIKSKINFELSELENVKFIWDFAHEWNKYHTETILGLCNTLSNNQELINLYNETDKWNGCFGVMSVIKWNFLDKINTKYNLFEKLLPIFNNREIRMGLERVFALMCYANSSHINTFFGYIHTYIKWGLTYTEYLSNNFNEYPIIKVWSGR
jgi:hypothetical protein